MYDPIIKELFPEEKPVCFTLDGKTPQVPAGVQDGTYLIVERSDILDKSAIDCLNGKYDLTKTIAHYGESCFPSSNARHHFLYLQMLCSATFGSSHYTLRKDLPSYLMTQTFHGTGMLRYEEKEYLLEKDDVFLIDCRKEHEYRALSQGGWGYRFIHFDGGMMAGYYQQIMNGGNMKFHFDENSDFQNQFKKLFKLCRENEAHKEIIVNLTLTQMITEILCQLTQYQTQEIPGGIIKQCGYIREHCCGKLGLEDLAKEFRLSKFHMSREFKKYTGKTIYEYITECRIAVAQRLLRYSDMPVGEIAEYVGFEDHNGFYRTFRQKEEVSPSVYRKNWRLL